ncbi:MAG TPA: glycosyltransferase [Acidimicrobiales bacterium]|nr:glycosyltransferase [Acidimicrobiales bacterium]
MTRTVAVTLDQLYRPQPGGIATYVVGLLDGLSALGDPDWRVVGVVPRGPEPVELAARALERSRAALTVRALTRVWDRIALGVPRGADVVHATTLAGPYGGGARGARHCVALHDLLWRDQPDAFGAVGRRFHESRLRAIRGRGDLRVVTTAPGLAARLEAEGFERSRLFESRLGVDLDGPAAPPEEVAAVLREAGVEGRYVLYAGTREPRKNLARLAEAHRRARGDVPGLGVLVLVGPAGWGEAPAGAVVLGRVERRILRGLIRDAQCLAYVPLAEGFGLPPIEALALGTPVVASETTPSVATNPEAILVRATDVASIAEGLARAAGLSHELSERERRRASVAANTWRRCALDHLEAWR